MDPQATYERWKAAVKRAATDDSDDAFDAWCVLTEWMAGGGFEPKWPSPAARRAFLSWGFGSGWGEQIDPKRKEGSK